MSSEIETVNKLIDEKAYDSAIEQAKNFLDEGKGMAHELEFAVVRALVGKKQIADAISKLVLLTEKHPLRENYFHYLGNLFMRMEWYDKAHEAYRRAIELYPDSYEFFGSLAECCRKQNDFDASFAAYERSIELIEQHNMLRKDSRDITPPLIVEGKDLVLNLEGKGDAETFSLYGLSADKSVGVCFSLGAKAEIPSEDQLKDPTFTLFSLKKAGTQRFNRDRVLECLTFADVARMELFPQSLFEATIYRRKGE
jgi:tetratricopeptide (TPR) repeat protein